MSWTGFKKAYNRAGTSILQKTGQVEKTDDSAFKEEEQAFKAFSKNTESLLKHSKAFLDSSRGMLTASARIATNIEKFYELQSSEEALAAEAFQRAATDLDANLGKNMELTYRATVLEPVTKLSAYAPEVSNMIGKRSKKLLDYDAARSKAAKYAAKQDDSMKATQAEKEAERTKDIFETMDGLVQSELPQFLDLRIPYLHPSFEALMRLQVHFASESYDKLGGVQRHFSDGVRDAYASGQLDSQVEGCLTALRDLQIVSIV